MKTINNAIDILKGKKSYIIGALSILLGILNGDTQLIMTGLGILTLRAGISKVSDPTNDSTV